MADIERIRRRAIMRIAELSGKYGLNRMITLTLPAEFEGVDIMGVWRKFRVYLNRKFPDIKYVWVKEYQVRGALHLHVLVDRWIPKDWLERTWRVLGGGSTRIEWVRSPKRYMAKYICKLEDVRRSYGTCRAFSLYLYSVKKWVIQAWRLGLGGFFEWVKRKGLHELENRIRFWIWEYIIRERNRET